MPPVYVETKTLPETILSALASVEFNRPTIPIYVSDTASVGTYSGDGMRAFTVLLDIDTGRRETHVGSWGGNNPFHQSPVDADQKSRPLPANGCVIHGHTGGGKPCWATLTIHPSRSAKLLPAPKDALSDRLSRLMAVFARFNSRGRAEWFERHGKATDSELAELEAMGLIKRNKAGAVTCTAAGKNAAPSEAYLYR
jgi:hypothetical protein